MVKHGSAVSRISQAQFNAILGVGNTVIPLTLLTNRINSNVRMFQNSNIYLEKISNSVSIQFENVMCIDKLKF